MERRWDDRIHIAMPAIVHADDGTSLKGVVHDISWGGVCLKIESPGELEMKKVVRVEFQAEDFVATIPSFVLRSVKQATALMFINSSSELQSFLTHKHR